MKEELRALTSLRGVAAFVVACFHLREFFGLELRTALRFPLLVRGYLWVDFFFILSGFVLAYVWGERVAGADLQLYRRYLIQRLARIYPLHVVVLSTYAGAGVARSALSMPVQFAGDPLWTFVGNLALLQGLGLFRHLTWNAPAWSISAEWGAYVLSPIVFAVYRRTGFVASLLATGAAYGGLVLLARGPGHGTLDLTFSYGWLRALLGFCLGCFAHRCFVELHSTPRARALATSGATWLVLAIGTLTTWTLSAWDPLLVPLLWALVVASAMVRGPVEAALAWAPLHGLGVVSYSIYLTHYPIGRAWSFAYHAGSTRGLRASTAPLFFCGALLSVLLVSVATQRWIEVPGRRWLVAAATRLGLT